MIKVLLVRWAAADFKLVDMGALACYLRVASETTVDEAGTKWLFLCFAHF